MSSDLKLALKAVKQAGRHIKKQFGKQQAISVKGKNDFVTETDVEAEKIILRYLKETDYSILGEETGETKNNSTKKWVIDPIDGTLNFINGNPFFAVSIGLIENNNELLLGVVYDPIADECYWAEKGCGAFLNGKRINVCGEDAFDGGAVLMTHGSSQESREKYLRAMSKLMLDVKVPVFNQGATALMLCLIARGSHRAFICCGDKLYDYAGGLIIAKEAGARISDWKGTEWDNSNDYILAANSELNRIISKEIECLQ